MKRVEIHYDGRLYTVADRTAADIEAELGPALAEGRSTWLDVNYGEGTRRPMRLLVSAGTPLALGDVGDS